MKNLEHVVSYEATDIMRWLQALEYASLMFSIAFSSDAPASTESRLGTFFVDEDIIVELMDGDTRLSMRLEGKTVVR